MTVPDCDTQALAQAIRRHTIGAIHAAGSGHPGGALSCADILAVALGKLLSLPPKGSDRFVLSKGHACPALYATWAELGWITHETLYTLRKLGSPLQGLPHPLHTPEIETSTGSLGQGISVAVGMALGYRHLKQAGRIVALCGDGEFQGGIVWEAAMAAGHYQLSHLTVILDYNKLQSDAPNSQIMGLEPLADKWRSFNWDVSEIDGHNHVDIATALNSPSDKPRFIIAHTVKGKGVPFMENVPAWHGSVKLSDAELASAWEALPL